jgi:hypothetical protein
VGLLLKSAYALFVSLLFSVSLMDLRVKEEGDRESVPRSRQSGDLPLLSLSSVLLVRRKLEKG